MSTIAAISTAPGIGGIGIVRISGEETYSVLEKIFVPMKQESFEQVKGYRIKYGHIVEKGTVIDEVLVSFFKAPHSYTKEDLCEIQSHGGMYIIRKILELCLANGAKLAEPGEFTQRAFLNGRLDLSQAEAVIDVIRAKTEKEAQNAMEQLEGGLSKELSKIREQLMSIMVELEVSIDYPEYDVEEVSYEKATCILEEVEQKLIKLQKNFSKGKIVREGIKVALIGKPNAGKSSLLNAILQEERAIVTDIAGTTRDVIEESVQIRGVPIHMIDTAGIRNSEEQVEQIGIERSRKRAQEADLIIAMFDVSAPITKEDEEIMALVQGKKKIVILNKMDLGTNPETIQKLQQFFPDTEMISISAKEQMNLDKIECEIEKLFLLEEITTDDGAIITNIRHQQNVIHALEKIKKAEQTLQEKLPMDMVGLYIKDIIEQLGQITGESVSDEIIKEIFSKFCLGK